ncbi:MAG: helix-turn-helix transcriptional regulator [Pseudomonadota bacterium]
MISTIEGFRLIAASQVMLLGVILWRAGGSPFSRNLTLTLLLCVCSYLLLPVFAEWLLAPAVMLMDVLASVIPGLLFVFAWHLFQDGQKRVPRFVWVLIVLYMLGLLPRHLFTLAPNSVAYWLTYDGAQLVKLGLTLAALVLVWRGREADLLASRLTFRYFFCAGLALVVALVVVIELASGFQVPVNLELLGMGAICLCAFVVNVWFLQPGRNLSFEEVRVSVVPPVAGASQQVVDQVVNLMREQRVYAQHDLKVADLADLVGVPEHVLRRAINGNLQQRNFNQFVNQYRIQEAAERLLSEPELPIVSIALDVGFRSLSSFNSAFKQTYQTSPSGYRRHGKGSS